MKIFRKTHHRQRLQNRAESLSCIPWANKTITRQDLENGDIVLSYTVPLSPLFQELHRRFSRNSLEPPVKRLQLDEMGSFVWRMIDGKKNVAELITKFSDHYQISRQEAETAVTGFLRTLGQRGLVGFQS